MPHDIVGIGLNTWDYILQLPNIPATGREAWALNSCQESGGMVSNSLVVASSLGADVSYIGNVGGDRKGKLILKELEKFGVDCSNVNICERAKSDLVISLVEEKTGDRGFIIDKGNKPDLDPSQVSRRIVEEASFVHFDDSEIEASVEVARWLQDLDTATSLNAEHLITGMSKLIELVDILVVSEFFALEYTGAKSEFFAAKQLLTIGPALVIVTLGEKGCLGVQGENSFYIPSFDVPVVDTTGAGDVFHGAFLFGLLHEWDYKRSAKFASAVAAVSCKNLGKRKGLPSLKESIDFLKQNSESEWS